MQEHPIPQNITTYQFRLIGNMTIKQFLLLLAGMGVAFLAYSTNLPGILKWPVIILAVLGGVALAFVPYEERMLDQWFLVFLRAIYRPTKYYWRRSPHPPTFFQYAPGKQQLVGPEVDYTPQRRQRVQSFLSSLPAKNTTPAVDPLDMYQQGTNLTTLQQLFQDVPAASGVQPGQAPTATRPDLTEHEHALHTQASLQHAAAPVAPAAPTTAAILEEHIVNDDQDTNDQRELTAPAPHSVQTVAIPVMSSAAPTAVVEEPAPLAPTPAPTAPAPNYLQPQTATPTTENLPIPAIMNRDLPFPSLPTVPNVVVGMVRTTDGNIVSNAILEILDSTGQTVRAMKTNNLGQFFISSPLPNGEYVLETEKSGFTFPRYSVTLAGNILDPIDILPAA